MVEFVAKRKKLLTRPVLKWEVDKAKYLKFEGEMHIGKNIKSRTPKEGDKEKEPATIVNVTDLQTGEPAQIIVNAVLKSVLTEEYPDHKYVGLCFAITKQARQPGKQYDPFKIEEIEDPAAGESSAEAPAASPTTAAGKRK